jgi:phenylalanyl-tRNA synthetase beta chain
LAYEWGAQHGSCKPSDTFVRKRTESSFSEEKEAKRLLFVVLLRHALWAVAVKFTLSWLREHLDTDAPLGRITDTLSSIGLEVEGVEDRAAALAPFRTARIIEAVKHPNADRLRACRVDIGTGEDVSVVCGAPNARTGLHVVFAPPGAYIPGTGITLKVGEIRGVRSAGMLVSAREMALGEDHDGIVELPDNTPVGVPYAHLAGLDDPVIEIGVTPNRGDALCVRGVARDLAAAGLGRLKPWEPASIPARFETPIGWSIAWPEACPWILGRSIRNVKNGESPDWLKRRLTAIGLRPISALVDVTNFFTFDLGRPLHVFDADRIEGRTLVLRPGTGVSFRALNGRDYAPMPDDLEIADDSGPVSLAGVIGGESTGSGDATNHVFLECALFDPIRIALSGRRHQISTDARQRFERGVDQAMLPRAVEAATRLILDLCGGEPGTIVSAGAEPAWQRSATLRFARLKAFGGTDISPDDAAGILLRLGFDEASRDATRLTVSVPPWRNDVAAPSPLHQPAALDAARAIPAREGAEAMEPECDLLEEVLRIAGMDSIPPLSMLSGQAVPPATLSARQARTSLARRLLAARGLAECVTYSFGASEEMACFGEAPASLAIKNPIAADLDRMRPTPLATLVTAARKNLARAAGLITLFEIGPGFLQDGEKLIAAGLRAGIAPRCWQPQPDPASFMAAKSDLFALLAALNVPMEALTVTPEAPRHYHPGRSGAVKQGPKTILGYFGELHPALTARFELGGRAAAFELDLAAIADPKRRRRGAPDLPQLQPVSRDFAFLVDDGIATETLLRAARQSDRVLISRLSVFDIYTGDPLPPGQKSVGIEVVFQPRERTLTDQEIEAACSAVVQAVTKATGARLR